MSAAPAEPGAGASDLVLERCRALGFALAGVCDARPIGRPEALRAWLSAGRHGEMAYLERHRERLEDPARLVPGARSIVCVADRYGGEPDPAPDAAPAPAPAPGRIARYARGDDYHKVIRRRLHALADDLRGRHPGHAFRTCVDTAPLHEREHAERAGLGAVGKHTLLIEPGVGSYLLLGAVVTTLGLEPTAPAEPDPCGSCTRCIDACPTGAISPWSVDATRCLSYLTIEHRSLIDERWHGGLGDWIFGCDVCQEVCPHNQPTSRTRGAPLREEYAPRRRGFDLLEVLGWDEAARREAFARSAMKRAKLGMMKRNALIAAGNVLARETRPELLAAVRRLAEDVREEEMVRRTARQVLESLES